MLMLEDKQKFEGLDHVLEAINNHRMATLSRDSTNMQLPTTFQPGKCDVLCCGGKEGSVHIGNKRYRVIIENNVTAYRNAKSKYQKSFLVSKIVASVKEASGNEFGGFVKKDPLTGRWYQVADKIAREKVSHALRDAIKVQKRKEARQRFINKRLHPRSLVALGMRFGMQNDTLGAQQGALAVESLIVPASPCSSSSLFDGCNGQGLETCVENEGDQQDECVRVVDDIFGTSFANCDDDWAKSLKESTKQFLQSPDDGDLCWT